MNKEIHFDSNENGLPQQSEAGSETIYTSGDETNNERPLTKSNYRRVYGGLGEFCYELIVDGNRITEEEFDKLSELEQSDYRMHIIESIYYMKAGELISEEEYKNLPKNNLSVSVTLRK